MLSKEHRPPHISIGGRSRFQERSNAPPPNHYNVTSGIGLRTQTAPIAPSWSIGGRSEVGGSHYSLVKKATPSPANYSTHLPETYNRGFTIQVRSRLKWVDVINFKAFISMFQKKYTFFKLLLYTYQGYLNHFNDYIFHYYLSHNNCHHPHHHHHTGTHEQERLQDTEGQPRPQPI